MACTVTPFDVLRTKLMNQPNDAKIYSGFVDCIIKVCVGFSAVFLRR